MAMSKLIQWNVLSLDGYFEGAKSWDVEWFHSFLDKDQEEFSIEQLRQAGALLFGRVTYEGMAAYWQTATGVVAEYMNSLPKVVFSRTLERAEWNNTRLIRDNAAEEAAKLKREMDADLFVFGSGQLCATLLEAGLFDEVRLGVAPVILGCGVTLFGRDLSRVRLKLLEARPLNSGTVILRYEPAVK
jgi:dihydrofolate reductase